MNRKQLVEWKNSMRIPRIRGDEPLVLKPISGTSQYSPHPRG